jgi:hypothetical protein
LTTWLKFGQFCSVPLLRRSFFVEQSKVLLVDKKWHLARRFIILD